jgi:hypothetical protein
VNPFSADELTRMRATQEAAMQDTCVLLARLEGEQDERGYPATEWSESAPVACGLDPRPKGELLGGAEVRLVDARLRLAIDTDVTHLDRVRITHRFGEELAMPELFAVLGEARRGPRGLMLDLRSVSFEGDDGDAS